MLVTTQERHGDAVVRVRGLLGRSAARDLRDALLKAAAGQPGIVICDLRAAVVQRNALTILLAVADQLEQWPGCPLAVLAGDPEVRAALGAVGLARRVPVAATVAEALDMLRDVRPAARAMVRLTPDVTAPARARRFLEGAVRDWPLYGVDLDAAALVLSELVTNAVLHAGTDLDVLVSGRADGLRIAVADEVPAPLEQAGEDGPADRRADDEHGRGLALVGALSRRWGVVPRGSAGKVVWAVLGVAEGRVVP